MRKQNLTTLYIVRHGESENNVKNIIGANPPLTEKGKQQAREIAKKLSAVRFTAICSSDLLRAETTAQIIASYHKLRIFTYKQLRERNYGRYEGKLITSYQKEMRNVIERMRTMADDEIKTFRRYKGFETDQELMLRFSKCLRKIVANYKNENILVITHGIVMRVSLIHLGFSTYRKLPPFSTENTGFIKITSDGINFSVREVHGVNTHGDKL